MNDAQRKKFSEAMKANHAGQCQFFLNAFWPEMKDKCEQVWNHWMKMKELDKQQFNALVSAGKANGEWSEGSLLDEFWSHKFLESIGKALSIVEFRAEFKKIDQNSDKQMGMLEFLVWEYKFTVEELMSRPQGGASEELERAQQLMREVEAAFKAAQTALDQAAATEAEALKRKEAATKSAQEAANAAALAATAAAEQQAAVDALKAQEESYAAKTKELTDKSEAGGVSGMRAKNELAQHLSEDPLPLRKAKITAEAAAKKLDKANKVAQDAKEAAEADRCKAEEAAAKAETDRIAAEEAVQKTQERMAAAEKYLEEQKAKGTGKTEGTFWWLDRELAEKKKYMPKSGKAKILM
jgi:hypothetical protein